MHKENPYGIPVKINQTMMTFRMAEGDCYAKNLMKNQK